MPFILLNCHFRRVSFVRLPTLVGMLPVSLLVKNAITAIFDIFPMLVGIEPTRQFSLSPSVISSVSSPMEVGMVPDRSFLNRTMSLSFERLPIVDGTSPIKEFSFIAKFSRFVRHPIVDGMTLFSLFFSKFSAVRLLKLPMLSDRVPINPLLVTISWDTDGGDRQVTPVQPHASVVGNPSVHLHPVTVVAVHSPPPAQISHRAVFSVVGTVCIVGALVGTPVG